MILTVGKGNDRFLYYTSKPVQNGAIFILAPFCTIDQISLFLNPLGWAKAIARYRAHQAESLLLHQRRRASILARQRKELAELDQWTARQQEQSTDVLLFNQLQTLFRWSLLAHQLQSYHQALSQGDILIITDSRKLILWTSQNFTSLTGYELDEVVGHSPQLLQGPSTDGTVVGYVGEQLKLAQAVEVDLLNYRKDGAPYLCHMRIEPLYNHQGSLTHFSAIERDVKSVIEQNMSIQTVV